MKHIDGIVWNKRTYEAAKMLEEALSGDRKSKNALFEALSTSDLAPALVPALNKRVLDEYEATEVSWTAFADTEIADDFRPQQSATYGFTHDAIPEKNVGETYIDGTLPRIPELGEYPFIGVKGASAQWQIFKRGAKFGLSWERLVNNRDLRELERATAHLAKMARNSEETAATLAFVNGSGINTTTMTDGTSGTNKNITTGNPALSAEALEAAFLQAAGHKVDGVAVGMPAQMNLIIPSGLVFAAERILNSDTWISSNGKQSGPNPLRGRFTIVVNDWLTRMGGVNGATTWVIAPKPGEIPNGGPAVGFLRGHENPRFFVRATTMQDPEEGDFDLDAYETKIRHTATDVWRGVNAGIVISNGSGS